LSANDASFESGAWCPESLAYVTYPRFNGSTTPVKLPRVGAPVVLGILPLYPPPPIPNAFPFHSVGKLTRNRMSGAVGSIG
jgi:hypothetical protein